jgi:hypothetical protein
MTRHTYTASVLHCCCIQNSEVYFVDHLNKAVGNGDI